MVPCSITSAPTARRESRSRAIVRSTSRSRSIPPACARVVITHRLIRMPTSSVDLAEADSRSHQGVLAFAFEQDVRPETTRIPRSRRRGRNKRYPCTRAVVECPRGAVEQLPVTCRLVLEVDDVLVATSRLSRSRTQRDRSAEPIRQRLVISRRRTVWQRDLRGPVSAHACRREEQLRNAPSGQTQSGLHVVDRELTVAFEAILRHRHFFEPLALQGLDGIAPQLSDLHVIEHTATRRGD